MDIQEVKKMVDDHVSLITVTPSAFQESYERATRFLVVSATLAEFKRQQEVREAQLATLKDAVFAVAIRKCEGKNITEKKALAAVDKEYATVAHSLGECEAAVSWARVNMRIFENAHIIYRMMAKGD